MNELLYTRQSFVSKWVSRYMGWIWVGGWVGGWVSLPTFFEGLGDLDVLEFFHRQLHVPAFLPQEEDEGFAVLGLSGWVGGG